jgi:hypothetical protein
MDGDSAESHQTTSHQRYVRYLDAATARPHIKQQSYALLRAKDNGYSIWDAVPAMMCAPSPRCSATTMLVIRQQC